MTIVRKPWRWSLAVLLLIFAALTVNAQSKKGAAATASSPSATQAPSSSAAFESQMLAYGGLDQIAKALAIKVCHRSDVDKDDTTIIIYDQTAFATLQSYQAFVANLQVLAAAYETLIPSARLKTELEQIAKDRAASYSQMLSNSTLSNKMPQDEKELLRHKSERWKSKSMFAGIDPIADVASLLSALAIASNTESPGQITIPDSAMALAVTREIKSACNKSSQTEIIYPPLFGKGSSSDFASADIQMYIQTLDDIRSITQKYVDNESTKYAEKHGAQTEVNEQATEECTPCKDERQNQNKTSSQAASTTTAKKSTKKGVTTTTGLTAVTGDAVFTAALTDINGLYDSFMNSLLQINASTGVTGSASVIQGYQLATLLKGAKQPKEPSAEDSSHREENAHGTPPNQVQSPAFVLLASVVSAGGTEQVHKTLLPPCGPGTLSNIAAERSSTYPSGERTPDRRYM